MKISEVIEKRMKDYGREAFFQHQDEVDLTVKAVCFCLEFLQNEENWGRNRAIPLRKEVYWDSDEWEKIFAEEYDRRVRREEFERLREELEHRKWRMGEKEIPLKQFLKQGLLLMIEETRWYSMNRKEWSALMELQMETNGFTDFRGCLEAIYMLGFAQLFCLQEGKLCHCLSGEHRDAEHFLSTLKPYIPEEGHAGYDRISREILQEQKRERRKAMEAKLQERDKKFRRVIEEIPLLKVFSERVEEMEEEQFAELVKPEPFQEEGWFSGEEEKALVCRKMKNNRIRNLAGLFVYTTSRARRRLVDHLSEDEQILVMEQWMSAFYPENEEMLEGRLNRMVWMDGLGDAVFGEEEEKNGEQMIEEALEKLLGRKKKVDGYSCLCGEMCTEW